MFTLFSRLPALAGALSLAAALTVSARAPAAEPFDAGSFQAAQAAGHAIVVDVTASWCPTCRRQRPILAEIEAEHADLMVYEVDFDTARDVLRRFGVQHQSTLIVFRGAREVGRSTGETDPVPLRALVAKAF